jgi:hypothetical protein
MTTVSRRPLDPVNPDILFGSTSSLWDAQHDIEWAIKRIAAVGLQGIEPYAKQIEKHGWLPTPISGDQSSLSTKSAGCWS